MPRLSRRSVVHGALVTPFFARARFTQAQSPLSVVATFSILGDLTANVAGKAIDLNVIVGPDGDAHTFEPRPEQIGWIADATVIIENGLGFEPWLDDMYASSGSTAIRLVTSSQVTPIAVADEEAAEAHAEETVTGDAHDPGHDDADHDHGEFDPHIWQDVRNAMLQVTAIRDGLTSVDPGNASTYASSTDAYISNLESLDTWIRDAVSSIPAEKRLLFTSHDAFGYFANAYGFTILGTALGAISTEAADPSAGQIADLIDSIRASGVPAIFVETGESDDLMHQIASDAGVTLAPPLHGDALTGSDGPAPTYIELMRSNVITIVTSLGGTVPN